MGGRGASSKGNGGGGGGGSLTSEEQAYIDAHGGSNPVSVDGKEMYVPQWIQEREGLYGGLKSVRETEKAVLVQTSDIAATGEIRSAWVPKSTMLTKKQYAQKGVENDHRKLRNSDYTKYLKDTAKANGVKIGNTSSWKKIQDKLTSKNVKFKTRNQF